MSLITLHVSNIYKSCEWNRQSDSYQQKNYDKSPHAMGTISEDIFKRLVNLNLYLLRDILKTPFDENYNCKEEIYTIINELLVRVKIDNTKIMGYSIEEFLESDNNLEQIIKFVLQIQFEESIKKFKELKPSAFAQYENYGQRIMKSLEENKYNDCFQLLLNINNMCQDFTMHMILQTISLVIFLFMDLKQGTRSNVTYELNMDTIAIRRAMTALQKLIIDESRQIYYAHELLEAFQKSHTIPEIILKSKNAQDIEQYIYSKIICTSTEIKNAFPHLTLRQKNMKWTEEKIETLYNRWDMLSENRKAAILIHLGMKKGQDYNFFPYILTINANYIVRRKIFTKYIAKRAINEYLPKEFRNEANETMNQFDKIWEHILFPDRQTWEKVAKDKNNVVCLNFYDTGDVSIVKFVKLFLTKTKILNKALQSKIY